MKPKLSYTIWFSQRTGSSLLCKALVSTGVAGNPDEWLLTHDGVGLLEHYGLSSPAELQEHLWDLGSTPNGVFGLKFSFCEPYFTQLLDQLRQFPGCPQENVPRAQIWEHAFPNCRNIFMTRRNKVRLAVSWWKAIQTQEWHRERGAPHQSHDISDAYSFDAINHLYNECSMREAGIQEFFTEGGIVPLTVTYEDFVQDYNGTVTRILKYFGLDPSSVNIAAPHYEQLADDLTETWVERFRRERQYGWTNRGW
jgi:LPS sulfotransferase NodH